MNMLLLNLLYFISSYILIFLLYVFVINKNKKTYKDASKQLETYYLLNKFNLDKRKTSYNSVKWYINIFNPLIISVTFVIVINIENIFMSIVVGFIVMLCLIYSIYELIGRHLKNKEV